MTIMENSITALNGVGENRAKLFSKLGIRTIEDMLCFFPRYMEDRSNITDIISVKDGDNVCILATVVLKPQVMRVRNNLVIYKVLVDDGTATMTLTWFNNKFIPNTFKVGDRYKFFGKINRKGSKIEMATPTYEKEETNVHTGRVTPIYPLTKDLHQKTMRGILKQCVDAVVGNINEYLPNDIRAKYGLCELNYAFSSIHFPETAQDYTRARYRFVFEELLLLQLGMLMMKKTDKNKKAPVIASEKYIEEFRGKMPFEMTGAQRRVLAEISADFQAEKPMSRLLQGDVGSGKTIVAFAAMYAAYKNGFQAALMAPTEVLAKQHYESALKYFGASEIGFLTGSVTGKTKQAVIEKIKNGEVKIVIGTHAVIEDNIEFKNLALAITDEQHRFGVKQRAKLAEKGEGIHTLVMSATPIPRTLALILYGDLDISVLDELPPGRQKIDTFSLNEDFRVRINAFMRKKIAEGRQIYVICPLIEESEKSDMKAATELSEHLAKNILPEYKVELLHGRMKSKVKNEIMQRFADGETKVLVSTTVIEVGINVPNATVMIVENAERFGLSQLHQIRGRVGRGSEKSYCILFSNGGGKDTEKRLEVMTKTNDGFEISRRDLELRGPGDFLGTRQHGLPEMKIANLFTDMDICKKAGECARLILKKDEKLRSAEYAFLRQKLRKMFGGLAGGNVVG